jgi:hypothetical protein
MSFEQSSKGGPLEILSRGQRGQSLTSGEHEHASTILTVGFFFYFKYGSNANMVLWHFGVIS